MKQVTEQQCENFLRGSVPGSAGVDQSEMTRTELLNFADELILTVRACIAGPPQREPPAEGDDGWWLWAYPGDDEELTEIQPGYKVRESWTDGEWCARLRIPERRG